jgi:hypothetical protein
MLENQTPRKRSRRHRGRQKSGIHPFNIEKLPLPRLSKATLELVKKDKIKKNFNSSKFSHHFGLFFNRLMQIP